MIELEEHDADATSPIGGETSSFALPALGSLVNDRYRITRLVGAGGMGTVFEAETTSVGRRCAIKFLRLERAGQSRNSLRFEREARLLAKLEHDQLTGVLDFGRYQGTPYYVMEFLDGETLRQLLTREGPLALRVALDVMRQTCRGMAYAHEQAVVHRDLKPDNLMLIQRSDGRRWIKILDFGVARWDEVQGAALTPTGAELGTPHYMSPEQARGAKDVDARADVFALGAIFYEMLTTRRAYSGSSYNEVLFKLLTQPHEPLEKLLPECPPLVTAVIERCLSKQASERYRDAGELLEALRDCEAEFTDGMGLQTPGAVAFEAPRGRPAPRLRSRRAVWLGFAVGTAFGGTVALVAHRYEGKRAPALVTMSNQPAPAVTAERAAPQRTGPISEDAALLARSGRSALAAADPPAPSPAAEPEPTAAPAAPPSPARRTRRPAISTEPPSAPPSPSPPAPAGSAAPRPAPELLEARAENDAPFPFLTSNPYADD